MASFQLVSRHEGWTSYDMTANGNQIDDGHYDVKFQDGTVSTLWIQTELRKTPKDDCGRTEYYEDSFAYIWMDIRGSKFKMYLKDIEGIQIRVHPSIISVPTNT